MEREGGSVCGGRNRGSRWRQERRGNGLGEETRAGGGPNMCMFVEWGGGIQVRLSDGSRGQVILPKPL